MNTYDQLIRNVIGELDACLTRVSTAEVDKALDAIDGGGRIFIAGAGRSALAMRGFAMRLMHLGRTVHVVGETTTPGIAGGDVLVIGSGSGRTASLAAAAQRADELGATIVLLTIDPQSPIGQRADAVVRIPAPSPKAASSDTMTSIQPMGSLFEQSLFVVLDTMVIMLMERARTTTDQMFTRHANLE